MLVVRALRRGLKQSSPLESLTGQVGNSRFKFSGKLISPAGKSVGPRLHRIFVRRDLIKCAGASPSIIVQVCHRRLMPPVLSNYSPLQTRRDDVVSVLKYVRLNNKILTHHAFDRKAPAVDELLEILDNDRGKGPKHGP